MLAPTNNGRHFADDIYFIKITEIWFNDHLDFVRGPAENESY